MGVNTEYDESNLMNSKRRTSTVSDDPVIIEKIKDYCELTENSTQVHQKVYIFGWKNFGRFFSRIFLFKNAGTFYQFEEKTSFFQQSNFEIWPHL